MNKSLEFFFEKVSVSRQNLFAVLVMLCFAAYFFYYLAAFFAFLNTTMTDFSWGDVSWVHQAVHNFVSGRPLQTSVYYFSGDGVTGNLYPYANQLAMHLNLTPYLFSFGYKFFPGLNALYITVVAFNLGGSILFLFLLFRHYQPDRFLFKYSIVLALLLSPWFIGLITYKCLFPLYQGVFIMALHYFFLKEKRFLFAVTASLLVLISEDAALFLIGYAAFLGVYSVKRFYPFFSAALASGYTFLTIFILHPVFKMDMLTSHKVPADVVVRLGRVFKGQVSLNSTDIIFYLGLAAAVFVIVSLLSGRLRATALKKAGLMVFVAPSSHWFITFVNGGGHHPLPVFVMILLAATYLLASAEEPAGWGLARYRLVFSVPFFFGVVWYGHNSLPSMAIDSGTDFSESRTGIKPRARLFSAYKYTVANSTAVMASNTETVATVRAIPANESVVYWTNRTVEGFFVNRNDIWRFPSYYDRADCLVIQKNAQASFFSVALRGESGTSGAGDNSMLNITENSGSGLAASIGAGRQASSWNKAPISPTVVAAIREELVLRSATHIVQSETESVLVLKRKTSYKFPMPNSSLGFGWLENVPDFLRRLRLPLP